MLLLASFRKFSQVRSALLVALLLSLSMADYSACGQVTTGSIVGIVEDATGAVVPGVRITATKVETGTSREATSSSHGDFTLNSMEPGTYTLRFSIEGFKTKEIHELVLTTGSTLPVSNIALEIGAVSQTTTVQAQGAAVATTSSDRSDLLSSNQINTLVVRGRNFTDLVMLSPGVINTTKSTDISSSPVIYVNGNRSTANAIFVDGLPANDMSSTQMKSMVSQDSISEVKIETSNFQAEYGRNAGSNIVATTKSGSKTFHGLLSYFNRNEAYNANNYFNNLNGIARPRYRYNTITYNIGGPVIIPKLFNNPNRDKLFFFFNEELWPTKTASTGSVTVPTALERNGDFSQSLTSSSALIVVKDPYNNNAPFPGNKIPASELNPNGLSLLNIFPLPNFTNAAVSKGNYNYVFSTPVSLPIRTDSLRMDYHPTEKDTISGTYGDFFVTDTGALGIPAIGNQNFPLMTKTYFSHSTFATGRELHIFSPSLLNEASFGFLQQNAGDTIANSELQKIARSSVGFNVGQFYPSANTLSVIPNTTFGGVLNAAVIGIEGRFPLVNHYYLYNYTDTVSYTRGTHNFKAGAYFEYYTRYQKTQSGVNFNGIFDFTANPANPLNTGYAYANAALGTFNSYKETSTAGIFNLQDQDAEGFLQDNWRVTRKLTLDLGLRLYYVTPFTEANNQISGFVLSQYSAGAATKLIAPVTVGTLRQGQDPGNGKIYPAAAIGAISPTVGSSSNGMVSATSPGSLPRSLQGGAGLKLGPRVGFAYDVFGNGKLAIRGGFGIFQNRFQENYFDNFVAQPPLAQTPQIFYGQMSTLLSSAGLLFPNNVYGPDTTPHLARVVNYSISVQQQIGFKTIFDLAYVGTQGRHLQGLVDRNAIPLGTDFLPSSRDLTQATKTSLPAAFLRPIVGYNGIYLVANGAGSSYNALQASVQRRFASRLQFGAAYTWSKVLDYADSDSDVIEPVVPIRQYYRSLATFDRSQNVVLNYIYDLPGVRQKLLGAVLNHWQLSGITTLQSGAPLGMAVSTSAGSDITGSTSIAPRAQLIGNPNLPRGMRTFSHFFNTAAVTLPATGTYGNAPRLFLRGPGINSTDLALMKNITLKERLNIQFRVEAYNVANHTQFSAVNTTAQFNAATGAISNGAFGAVTAARDPRQLQMSARVSF